MNNQNNLTNEMKIANCQCCLLAKVMRDCDTCPFKMGLIYKRLDTIKRVEAVKVEYPAQLKDATLAKLITLV